MPPTHHQERFAVEADFFRDGDVLCLYALLAEGRVRRCFRFFFARLLFLDMDTPYKSGENGSPMRTIFSRPSTTFLVAFLVSTTRLAWRTIQA